MYTVWIFNFLITQLKIVLFTNLRKKLQRPFQFGAMSWECYPVDLVENCKLLAQYTIIMSISLSCFFILSYGDPDATSKFVFHFCIFRFLIFRSLISGLGFLDLWFFGLWFSGLLFLGLWFFGLWFLGSIQVLDFCFELNFSYKATLT